MNPKHALNLFRFVWRHPLNSENKLRALGRLLRWQIGSRLLPGMTALPFVEKTRLFATRGMTGATGNWYSGLHETAEMGFVLHLLRPTDHFLDVGANIGSYAILAAGAVGAYTVAVEPIPETFACLRRNILLNDLEEKVRCCQIGLSDREAVLRFTSDLDTVNHVISSGEEGPSIEVPAMTLDALVGNMIPAAIKIDVEGHELRVLGGASRVLADQRVLAVIMETNGSGARYGVGDGKLFDVMYRHQFEPYGYDPLSRTLVGGQPNAGNTIFVRDVETVKSRIETARKYSLVNRAI